MPTTITSAGITFNDATSLTSANIGTAQLVNGSVIASKLGTNEQKQICKAWVNFDGVVIDLLSNLENGAILTPTNGGNTVNWYSPAGVWTSSSVIGTIRKILNIGGSSSGTLGGVPCSQLFLQLQSITNVNNATFRLVNQDGTPTSIVFSSATTVTGNGTSTGMQSNSTGIRSSYNVSSVTKNGTGDYTVNFATPMADANYSVVSSSGVGTSGASTSITITSINQNSVRLTYLYTHNFLINDGSIITVQVFGN
jgi:hypothetical protein